MKNAVRIVVFASAVLTLLHMAVGSRFADTSILQAGRVNVQPFDFLMVAAVLTFAGYWFQTPLPRTTSVGRLVVALVAMYLSYQVVLVLPMASLLHDVGLTVAVRLMTPRFLVGTVVFYLLLGFCLMRRETVVNMWTAVGLLIVAYASYRALRYGATGWVSDGVFRVRVLWGSSLLGIGWVLVVSPIAARGQRVLVTMSLVAAGIVGLVLVNHRAAYLAAAVTVAVYLLAERRAVTARLRVLYAVSAIGVMGVVVLASLPALMQSTAYSLQTLMAPQADTTSQNRVATVTPALDFIGQHPFGDGTWTEPYRSVSVNGAPPENLVLNVLVEQGIVGAAFWSIVLVVAFATAWRNRRDSISAAMLCYLVYYVTFCFFNASFAITGTICLLATAIAMIMVRDADLHISSGRSYTSRQAA